MDKDLKEIEDIISNIGNSTRYEDEIGGVKVNPILWHTIPSLCAKAILKWHNKRLADAVAEAFEKGLMS